MIAASWPAQKAKNRFDELIDKTLSEGPQTITRRGVPVATIYPATESRTKKPRVGDLATFFANSPLAGSNLDLSRSPDTGMGRIVEL